MEIFSWLIPSIVTIIGFVVTYFVTQRNFKNEVKKSKTSIAIEKLQKAAHVLIAENHKITKSTDKKNLDFVFVFEDLILYGSKDLVKIAIDYQTHDYNKNDIIFFNALLCSQLKYESIGEYLDPVAFLKHTTKDYKVHFTDEQVKYKINKIVNERGYNKHLKCK